MFGAIYGDIIGSYYENHCTKDYDFPLMRESSFTDDSVLTATAFYGATSIPAYMRTFCEARLDKTIREPVKALAGRLGPVE